MDKKLNNIINEYISLGISSWPSTLMNLMGFVPPADYDKSIVNMK